jgi:two-component system, chemotaxis family, protein-glutamate methylesterase/glutaminase
MEPLLVMLGVSAGGLNAVCGLLRQLPEPLGATLVVVQHRSKESTALCEVFQGCTDRPVHEVVDKAPIEPGRVYVAPADYHLLVEDGHFALSLDAPQLYSRPSIDVAFESAAEAFGSRVVGVVLTGANHDGSRGLRRIVEGGGYAIVQDPQTAEVAVMPAAALQAVPTAEVLPLDRLAARLVELENERRTPRRRTS